MRCSSRSSDGHRHLLEAELLDEGVVDALHQLLDVLAAAAKTVSKSSLMHAHQLAHAALQRRPWSTSPRSPARSWRAPASSFCGLSMSMSAERLALNCALFTLYSASAALYAFFSAVIFCQSLVHHVAALALQAAAARRSRPGWPAASWPPRRARTPSCRRSRSPPPCRGSALHRHDLVGEEALERLDAALLHQRPRPRGSCRAAPSAPRSRRCARAAGSGAAPVVSIMRVDRALDLRRASSARPT